MNWPAPVHDRMKIFLADPSGSITEQVAGWTQEPERCALSVFESSHQLLRRAQYERPDVILLDLTMPRMDGLTMLRALAPSGVPVVMLGAHTMEGARAAMDALLAGAADCLVKMRTRDGERIAVTQEEFFRRLRRAIATHSSDAGEETSERAAWRRLEVDSEGRVAAGALLPDAFPRDGEWTGLALCQPRCVGRMIRAFAHAPERPAGPMLTALGLPPRFTHALAETAGRYWNRVVLEARDGETPRRGQWRVIPGLRLAAFAGERQRPRVELLTGRRCSPGEALRRQIELASVTTPESLRLYLFEQPDAVVNAALERMMMKGATVLLAGNGAGVLKFDPELRSGRSSHAAFSGMGRKIA